MPDSAVSYIQVQPTSNLFTPATRAFGNIAIIGDTTGTTSTNPFETFIRPDEALQKFPGALGDAIATAFKQTPGPTVVYGVHAAGPDFTDALTTVSKLDVQLVVLAHTALTDTTAAAGNPSGTPATAPGAVVQLAQHVNTVSQHGGDGKERMGVAMFPPGVPKIVLLTNDLKSDRMVYIAHKSIKQDVAAA